MNITKYNLGCSDDLREGFINVDGYVPISFEHLIDVHGYVEGSNNRAESCGMIFEWWNLKDPWKICNDSADYIVAKDVFEHIDNDQYRGQRGIIWCMNEAHRCLKPGGLLELTVPCLPGSAPWVDPTHVSVWTADLRYYFCEEWNNPQGERGRLGPAYGITALFRTVGGRSGKDWKPIQYARDAPDRSKLFLILEAVK